AGANATGAFQRRVLNRVMLFRLGPVLRVVQLAEEPGMHDRDVIALEIVVDVYLPVAVQLPVLAAGEAVSAVVALAQVVEQLGAEVVAKRDGVIAQVHEHEIVPRLHAKLRKAEVRAIEALDAFHLRRREQPAIETVRPSVIAALQDRSLARAFRNRAGAMTADVRHRAQNVVTAT